MKNENFKVQILNEDSSIKSEKLYKSLKEISTELKLDYYIVRELNKITDEIIKKKFLHPNMSLLSKKIKIFSLRKKLNINDLNI
jgi:hypothetical protein